MPSGWVLGRVISNSVAVRVKGRLPKEPSNWTLSMELKPAKSVVPRERIFATLPVVGQPIMMA